MRLGAVGFVAEVKCEVIGHDVIERDRSPLPFLADVDVITPHGVPSPRRLGCLFCHPCSSAPLLRQGLDVDESVTYKNYRWMTKRPQRARLRKPPHPGDLIKEIRKLAQEGRISYSKHALQEQMPFRGFDVDDVEHV